MNKKGAIEFSMTTIIVVIIGVVILALAIPWVTKTLRSTTELTDVAFEKAIESLRGTPTPDQPIMLSQDSFKLKRGEKAALAVRFLNAGDAGKFSLSITGIGLADNYNFKYDETKNIDIAKNGVYDWKVTVSIPNSATPTDYFPSVTIGTARAPLVITVE